METQVEETVQDEATAETAAPTGKAAFDAARASLSAQSKDDATSQAKDDTSTNKPAEDTAEVADQPTEATDKTDALLTPEELAALSPKERAQAEKWQAKLTQESQRQAAQRKELEGLLPLVEALKTDPLSAIEKIATANGLKLSKAAEQDTKTVDKHTAAAMADVPEDLQFLKPVLESVVKKVLDSVKAEVAPIKEAHAQMASETAAAETTATLATFDAKYPGWKKHEGQMSAIAAKFVPVAGSMTDFEYMEQLYTLATAKDSAAEKTKKVVEKINKAAASVEPTSSGMPAERVEHALPPPEKRTMRDAYNAAKAGIRWSDK